MKLSISNIAWEDKFDEEMYKTISDMGFSGIEIAPTRIFKINCYDDLIVANKFSEEIKKKYNLEISSMQSIWFGRTETVFGSLEERKVLINYTKKAIDFASVIGCKNLVFGSPKNRISKNEDDRGIAIKFFGELGKYAEEKGTVLALEPNPVLYGTNFINTTEEAINLVKEVGCNGFKVNLDLGTIIYNEELLESVKNNIDLINHIHISEPNLAPIKKRELHEELARILKDLNYSNYISIEMGKMENVIEVKNIMKYIHEVFI